MSISMKKRSLFIFFTLALISAIILLWKSTQPIPIVSSSNTELVPVEQALLELENDPAFKQLDEAEKKEKVFQVLEEIPPKYKKLKRFFQISMQPLPEITLYGRVIDQYGQPVTHAEILYTGTGAYLAKGSGTGRVYTDDDGNFKIETVGASLDLLAVSEKSIVTITAPMPGIASFLSRDDPYKKHLNWTDYSKKENIYTVQAWRLGEYEGAIKGLISGHYNSDGRDYTLSLNPSHHYEQKKEGIKDGHIYISCSRSHIDRKKEYSDWSVKITPINGGILETDDIYTTLAPETGYQPSLDINMRKGEPGYKFQLKNKDYYFMSNNGEQYGSLRLSIYPFFFWEKEVCLIDVNYKINPTGSRNLELKPPVTIYSEPTPRQLLSNSGSVSG